MFTSFCDRTHISLSSQETTMTWIFNSQLICCVKFLLFEKKFVFSFDRFQFSCEESHEGTKKIKFTFNVCKQPY